MAAITREKPGQFRIRFAELERGLLDRFRPPDRVVDPFLVCRAATEVMRQASMRSASGRLLAWDEYRIILAPADLEPLRPFERRLRQDVEAALTAEGQRLQAELLGPLRVHLVADEGGELRPGEAVIRAGFAGRDAAGQGSDMTIRASGHSVAGLIDTGAAAGATVHVPDRQVVPRGCVVTWAAGEARLPDGVRTVIGRPHAGPPAGFVPLTGASTRISKQQAWLIPGPGGVVVGRPERANPVEVGGALVPPGQEVRVTALPAELSLSRGELVLLLSRG